MYDRDEKWEAFYQKSDLSHILVEDKDIEVYDWENQTIILTKEASTRINDTLGDFIVVLGDKRLYGGRGIHIASAMPIRFPVIYTMENSGRTELVIRSAHELSHDKPNLDDELWERIASPEIKEHFQSQGKLQ